MPRKKTPSNAPAVSNEALLARLAERDLAGRFIPADVWAMPIPWRPSAVVNAVHRMLAAGLLEEVREGAAWYYRVAPGRPDTAPPPKPRGQTPGSGKPKVAPELPGRAVKSSKAGGGRRR